MDFYADLHLHGKYSGGVSKKLTFEDILWGARRKGINLVGTGDILHPHWLEEVRQLVVESSDVYINEEHNVYVLPTVEVEDRNRVHHILIFPSFSEVEEARSLLQKCGDIDTQGRPKLDVDGTRLLEVAESVGALLGPAHAFTPYYGIYAHTDSIKEYYGEAPHFLELGLSADSYMADKIGELRGVPFLSNSDAHSGSPHRIGREFQKMKGRPSFKSVKSMDIVFNAGLDPREGKYHLTACNRCYKKYRYEDAARLGWKCVCGGRIKKGVKDRVKELSNAGTESNRPPYYHLLPLIEIIRLVKGYGEKRAEELYDIFLEHFGNEIRVLVEVRTEEIGEIDEDIGKAVRMMREGKVVYYPGGGGKYGEPYIPLSEEEYEKLKRDVKKRLEKEFSSRQTSILEFA